MRRGKDRTLATRRLLYANHNYAQVHIGIETARVFRGRIHMLLHPASNGGTAAQFYTHLRNFDLLAV
jgi:hypothetical protein